MKNSGEDKVTPPTKENPAYIFHHFMKCGGSSVGRVLAKWFNVKYDHFKTFDQLEEYKNNRLDLSELHAGDCVVGHYAVSGTYLFERYPELENLRNTVKPFTIIRDPLEFCLSLYYYSKRHGRMDMTLEEYFDHNRNLLAYHFPCDESDFERVIEKYFFTGTLERIEESLNVLSKMVNRKFEKIERVNVSKRDDQTKLLTTEFVERFKKRNELDYEIYRYVNERLDKMSAGLE